MVQSLSNTKLHTSTSGHNPKVQTLPHSQEVGGSVPQLHWSLHPVFQGRGNTLLNHMVWPSCDVNTHVLVRVVFLVEFSSIYNMFLKKSPSSNGINNSEKKNIKKMSH